VLRNARKSARIRVPAESPAAEPARHADETRFHDIPKPERSGNVDLATYHWLYRETINKLDDFRLRVSEGKDLEPAREFCAYVLWSGLVQVLKPHDNSDELKVDSAFLEWTASDLQSQIQERWRTGRNAPAVVQMSELKRIHDKLDVIAGRISQMPTLPSAPPVLRVVSDSDLP